MSIQIDRLLFPPFIPSSVTFHFGFLYYLSLQSSISPQWHLFLSIPQLHSRKDIRVGPFRFNRYVAASSLPSPVLPSSFIHQQTHNGLLPTTPRCHLTNLSPWHHSSLPDTTLFLPPFPPVTPSGHSSVPFPSLIFVAPSSFSGGGGATALPSHGRAYREQEGLGNIAYCCWN